MSKTIKKTIGIIILHFGNWQVTKECLDSLIHISYSAFHIQVIVVDNSQNKQTQSQINKHSIVNKLITPLKNLGFAAGNNLAIKFCQKSNYDFVLLLNNDTIVTPNFLQNLYNFHQTKNKLFISGPILKHRVNKQTLFDFGGYINLVKGQPRHINLDQNFQITNKAKHPSKQIQLLKKITNQKSQTPIPRDFISGCCMLIPIEIIKQIGLLREDYFMYLEDVEFCLRASKKGFQTYINPTAQIFHKGSQSSTEWNKIKYSWRNSLKLVNEYVDGINKITALMFNFFFYPGILIIWKLKAVKHKFFTFTSTNIS